MCCEGGATIGPVVQHLSWGGGPRGEVVQDWCPRMRAGSECAGREDRAMAEAFSGVAVGWTGLDWTEDGLLGVD